jgi:hypothetical protein
LHDICSSCTQLYIRQRGQQRWKTAHVSRSMCISIAVAGQQPPAPHSTIRSVNSVISNPSPITKIVPISDPDLLISCPPACISDHHRSSPDRKSDLCLSPMSHHAPVLKSRCQEKLEAQDSCLIPPVPSLLIQKVISQPPLCSASFWASRGSSHKYTTRGGNVCRDVSLS